MNHDGKPLIIHISANELTTNYKENERETFI